MKTMLILCMLVAGSILCSMYAQAQNDGDIRLVGGRAKYEGRIEVFYNNTWGTICDNEWGLRDARVACRQLGFTRLAASAAITRGAFFGKGTGPIWLEKVNCDGSENSIINCTHLGWSSHTCNHGDDSAVICSEITNVRINGTVKNIGRVEVLYADNWIPVCNETTSVKDVNWTDEAASVVCKQLGFDAGGVAYDYETEIGLSILSVPYRANNVRCNNNETRIQDCNYEVQPPKCFKDVQAAVFCYTTNTTTALPGYNSGILYVGVIGGLVVILLLLVLVCFIFRHTKQDTAGNSKQRYVRPEETTIGETSTTPAVNTRSTITSYDNQTFEPDEGADADNNPNMTINSNDHAYTYVDINTIPKGNNISKEYAYADTTGGHPSTPSPSVEGWMDNTIYAASNDVDDSDIQITDNKKEGIGEGGEQQKEGWKNNSIYSSSI